MYYIYRSMQTLQYISTGLCFINKIFLFLTEYNNDTKIEKQYSHDIETLLHSAGGHQGSRKAHLADKKSM